MKRRRRMPFGAEIEAGRGVRFRLWAPGAQSVQLCLESLRPSLALAMTNSGDGWFELTTRAAAPGSRYRYAIDGKLKVPDPVSRCNPQDVHGASEVIDPCGYEWHDGNWRGRPWHEAVIYELHIGTFTPEGTVEEAVRRLPYLRDLGMTAVELMPIADFPGRRNWGYDGVLPFAPDSRYGRPEAFKQLVDEAHRLGLMVLLDVVYNHFGPEGNYLGAYAPQFFAERHRTPWGAAINFDGPHSRTVRDFFIHNALYWLEEFNFDGLRMDAVDAIVDDSPVHILTELAEAVREGPGRTRHVHLVLENDDNAARYLERDPNGRARWYDAQWNDDLHHPLHVLLTGEREAHYRDYADQPEYFLGRALAEGYAFQGERSIFRDRPRGEPSGHLPASAFVAFLQNHDQVGNRAFGERLITLAAPERLRAGFALLLLAPSIPLIFMGEEFGCAQPFPFFCDFSGDLAHAVTEGRRNMFAAVSRFRHAEASVEIPDPNAASTFEAARFDWSGLSRPAHAAWLAFVRELLAVRHREIIPRLPGLVPGAGKFAVVGKAALRAEWRCVDGSVLAVAANLGDEVVEVQMPIAGASVYALPGTAVQEFAEGRLPPCSVMWSVLTGVPR